MSDAQTATIETRIPARLDRLPWSRFHWLVIIGLGTVWIRFRSALGAAVADGRIRRRADGTFATEDRNADESPERHRSGNA